MNVIKFNDNHRTTILCKTDKVTKEDLAQRLNLRDANDNQPNSTAGWQDSNKHMSLDMLLSRAGALRFDISELRTRLAPLQGDTPKVRQLTLELELAESELTSINNQIQKRRQNYGTQS